MSSTISERFWPKVDKSRGPDICWPWTASLNKFGYGKLSMGIGGKWSLAHRIAYELSCGPIPPGTCVCHAHLWLGTQADNMADMTRKGRGWVPRGNYHPSRTRPEIWPRGERHGRAVLTETDVRVIRTRHMAGNVTFAALATEFGVNESTVSRIVQRRRWRHVE